MQRLKTRQEGKLRLHTGLHNGYLNTSIREFLSPFIFGCNWQFFFLLLGAFAFLAQVFSPPTRTQATPLSTGTGPVPRGGDGRDILPSMCVSQSLTTDVPGYLTMRLMTCMLYYECICKCICVYVYRMCICMYVYMNGCCEFLQK